MFSALDDLRSVDWGSFTLQAMHMAILAADEIRITEERGLELINHPHVGSAQPIPSRQAT
ncbi:MAG: hypothetical protein COW24_02450 [Candidatus Kerfeldbacteria bacterium CG15_BIG_FIL_POST_REV_8_21_14_020_45_12]|uniref:Uncharacterized protein n=1 Tax=Candidatus Kerfeldbacteria bacterium CG15_BIG_FIL_POST_REV_8_21_14_020_45_12 TaxID=2014247 RepID=A0A2M7H456_9BACT|nr:MAG: hypothetical protein COW24_02450 [Candidatus Kerfeldbacteria bacterium CG15_BIG_FIL_POST_REV_8_21_14_020_45_12]PJA92860.1 MAG: hypothetical protein CO132_05675 [Candidatus Kerfeldbacteria bacterium CG_4_9_14_3_um_filter_45_8]